MAVMAFAASVPMMAYHGARIASVSTSPISIGVPGGDRGPVVLDMATSVASMGKLVQDRKDRRRDSARMGHRRAGAATHRFVRRGDPAPARQPEGFGARAAWRCFLLKDLDSFSTKS